MQSSEKRKYSIYDQNGFRTDDFSYNILQYLKDPLKINAQVQKWKQHIIPKIKQFKQINERVLINHVREGIPDEIRKTVWPQLIMKPIKLYSCYEGQQECKQIDLDLDRTFPNNKNIKQLMKKMRSVLNAIALAIPELGYCQGMNFISAIILLKLDEEEAFNVMYHIFHWQKHEELLINLDQIHRKMFILDKLIKKFYPELHKTLSEWKIECLFYAAPWFITIFCNTLPCDYVLRIIEMYLMEGEKILYRVALQILSLKKKKLKKLKQFQHVIQELKNFEDLTTTQSQIDKFVQEMFKIKLSRKDIQALDKEFSNKIDKQSLKKPEKQ